MSNVIEYLKIENFRSIDVLELHNIKPFSVFAGANGSGKSNFFDALDFVSRVLRFDLEEALAYHGGVDNIVCWKRDEEARKVFRFEIAFSELKGFLDVDLVNEKVNHKFYDSNEMQTVPIIKNNNNSIYELEEIIKSMEEVDDIYPVRAARPNNIIEELKNKGKKDKDIALIVLKAFIKNEKKIHQIHLNFKYSIYRINPNDARKSGLSSFSSESLNKNGDNLTSILKKIEKVRSLKEILLDWLTLIIPNFKDLKLENERLTNTTVLAFQEENQDHYFPPHLISDGTMYLLCLLVAVLDRPPDEPAPILIEEPERGLHPKAILELTGFFREHATLEQPIWLTTHNESLVRGLQSGELWLVDKVDGATQMKKVEWDDMPLPLDQAWLANALSGGLPW